MIKPKIDIYRLRSQPQKTRNSRYHTITMLKTLNNDDSFINLL